MVTGDRNGYLNLYLESGSGLVSQGYIRANNVPIDVGANSCPVVNDWNEDGRKDLITGQETGGPGNIRLYLNQGTNSAPAFGGYSYIAASGSPIVLYRANPTVFDLDQDGLKDLVTGEQNGYIYFYKNSGTNANPVFTTSERLRTTIGGYIDAYYGSRIHFVDWQGDGDPDLLVSGYDGFVEYYENATVGVEEQTKDKALITGLSISPNPIRERTVFEYSLAKRTHVLATVYSTDGREVATPIDQYQASGNQQFVWHARDNAGQRLPSGVFFVEFKAGSETSTERILIIR